MRWLWIDRFVEFESGRRAVTVKNVSSAEEQIHSGLPGCQFMPASLIVEGLAQTGGLLVGQMSDFHERIVLAKVTKATFHELVFPGDTLTYTATLERRQPQGAMIHGTSHVGERLQAEIDLVMAQLDERFPDIDQFDPGDLLRMLRALRLFEVGYNVDGTPLQIPDHMLAAERGESRTAQ